MLVRLRALDKETATRRNSICKCPIGVGEHDMFKSQRSLMAVTEKERIRDEIWT